MPTYEYTCTECGEQVEVVQKFTDDPLTVCTACGGRLRKVFSPVGIVFKGSGFYRTDSRNGSSSDGPGKKDKDKDKEPSGSKADSKSGSSADSGVRLAVLGLVRLGFLGPRRSRLLVRLGLGQFWLVRLRLVLVRVLLRVRRQKGHQEFGVGRLVLNRWLASSG